MTSVEKRTGDDECGQDYECLERSNPRDLTVCPVDIAYCCIIALVYAEAVDNTPAAL